MQKRLRKFRRDPDAPEVLGKREITERSLHIIANLTFYHFLPTSLLLRLVSGDARTTQRHLQMLFQFGYINRFTLPAVHRNQEFIYYLDSLTALELLIEHEWAERENLDFETVRRNREKAYSDIHKSGSAEERQGRMLFIQHELMISRFHACLELACKQSNGEVELIDWRQGTEIWHSIELPKTLYERKTSEWRELKETEQLPHRPDAFFSLRFPERPEENQEAHFYYEADRKTTTDTKRVSKKLRAHFHYIVKNKQHRKEYGVERIRAVLVETINPHWADKLREMAKHPVVSGSKPSPLFWFTPSTLFTHGPATATEERELTGPYFLAHPEIIFQPLWATPVDDQLYSLLD